MQISEEIIFRQFNLYSIICLQCYNAYAVEGKQNRLVDQRMMHTTLLQNISCQVMLKQGHMQQRSQ